MASVSKANKSIRCCFVQSCTSQQWSKKDDRNVRMFSFPNDLTRRAQWVDLCRRQDTRNPKSQRICERHFSPRHIVRRDKNGKLLNRPHPTDDAVPTRLLPKSSYVPEERDSGSLSKDTLTCYYDLAVHGNAGHPTICAGVGVVDSPEGPSCQNLLRKKEKRCPTCVHKRKMLLQKERRQKTKSNRPAQTTKWKNKRHDGDTHLPKGTSKQRATQIQPLTTFV